MSQHCSSESDPAIGRAFQRFSQRLGHCLGDLVLPRSCLCCGGRPGTHPAWCPRCQAQAATPDPTVLERLCPIFSVGISRAFAPWYTEPAGPARALVHAVKYSYRPGLARWAGRMAAVILPRGAHYDALVPIPIHSTRRAERGFNQAELIAGGVQSASGIPIRSALSRRIPRRSQTRASAKGRRDLPDDTFRAILPVSGQCLLLVDDVVTTGSTVNTAARALLCAGAARVDVVSLAVSRRPGSP